MKQSVNVQILRERKGLCFWEKKNPQNVNWEIHKNILFARVKVMGNVSLYICEV